MQKTTNTIGKEFLDTSTLSPPVEPTYNGCSNRSSSSKNDSNNEGKTFLDFHPLSRLYLLFFSAESYRTNCCHPSLLFLRDQIVVVPLFLLLLLLRLLLLLLPPPPPPLVPLPPPPPP